MQDPRTKSLDFIPASVTGKTSRAELRQEGEGALRAEFLRVREAQVVSILEAANGPVDNATILSQPAQDPEVLKDLEAIDTDDDDIYVASCPTVADDVAALYGIDQSELLRWLNLKVDFTLLVPAKEVSSDRSVGMKSLWNHIDILEWWKLHEVEFPTIASIARRFLACPASQSFQERVFSGAKIVMDDKRSNLTPVMFESLTVLRHNKIWLRDQRAMRMKRKLEDINGLNPSSESTSKLPKI